jgi:hypothetical protein
MYLGFFKGPQAKAIMFPLLARGSSIFFCGIRYLGPSPEGFPSKLYDFVNR